MSGLFCVSPSPCHNILPLQFDEEAGENGGENEEDRYGCRGAGQSRRVVADQLLRRREAARVKVRVVVSGRVLTGQRGGVRAGPAAAGGDRGADGGGGVPVRAVGDAAAMEVVLQEVPDGRVLRVGAVARHGCE